MHPYYELVLFLILVLALLLVSLFTYIPSFEELEDPRSNLATQILAEDGEVLTTYHIENRSYVSFDDLSQGLKDAIVATEDARFYSHSGIDFKSLARVGVKSLLLGNRRGGELLEVEAGVMDGTGKLELTGNLGQVMQESVKAAYTCLRSRARELGIAPDFYKTKDIHVHFPEGAVPKDGPSAGIAITTAMLSALTGRAVRHDVAMTGEVTLRGRVLPIGGLKEKTMAALRNGIHTVILPKENEKDLAEIDQTVRKALHFIPVESVDAVFAAALVPESREDAVEHMAAIVTDTPYQEVRHGHQL